MCEVARPLASTLSNVMADAYLPTERKSRGRGRGNRPPVSQVSRRPTVELSSPAGSANATPGSSSTPRRAIEVSRRCYPEARSSVSVSDNYISTRPPHLTDKKGTSGDEIQLCSNYLEVISKPNWTIHQYHVNFSPNVESPRIRHGLLAAHKETIGENCLFDGMSDLKTFKRLDKITEVFSTRETDGEPIKITLKYICELTEGHPELNRLYNVQMRRNLRHLEYTALGRYLFNPKNVTSIPKFNLEVWEGAITSIRQQEEQLMMLVDTTHKVIRKDTALQVIDEVFRRANNTTQGRTNAVTLLANIIVMTKYNNRTYRIEDIVWDQNPTSRFSLRNGEEISFEDYYKKQYDVAIKNIEQPLLLCISKEKVMGSCDKEQKKVLLIPELCNLTGLSEKMRTNYQLMKAISDVTRISPQTRVKNLYTFLESLRNNDKVREEMDAWQIRFSEKPVSFTGRVLRMENIIQRQNVYRNRANTANFSVEMRNRPMHSTMKLIDWFVICPKKIELECEKFLHHLRSVSPGIGFEFTPPRVARIPNDSVSTYIEAFHRCRTQHSNFVVFIVPTNIKNRYDALKKHVCVDYPMASQIIVSRTLTKSDQMLRSIATKIGIQMNCKLGGEAWALEIPFKKPVMIIGFDTYHDSLNKGRSAGAFVASLNPLFTRWYSRVSFHGKGGSTELTNHMKIHFTAALKMYFKVNRKFPALIFFYRDGVGDGQIRYVLEHEVKQIRSTITELLEDGETSIENMKTQFAFIIVNKRINTRFFQVLGDNKFGNPPPGTIVDHKVTHHERFDFFLVSQSVNQGTVSPTQYNVVVFHCGLKPDYVQQLTYKLTHLYFNWPGTISVPAPCLYAHKLAFLTGQSLHHPPAEELADTLFYL